MDCAAARALDPLDWEIVERAVVGLSDAVKADLRPDHIGSDVELQPTLRSELAEMVCSSCVSDTDAILDIFIEAMSEKIGRGWDQSHRSP